MSDINIRSKNLDTVNSRLELDTKPYTVNFSEEDAAKLKQIADEQGITANHALQKAIRTVEYIRNHLKKGHKILVQTGDDEFYQITFK